MSLNPPLSSLFDLSTLTEKSIDIVLLPSIAERAAIAQWLEASAVERMEARVHIERKSAELYTYDASFDADVVQACVVTLEPVRSKLKGEFHRALRLPQNRRPARRKGPADVEAQSIEIVYGDEDGPEMLESTKYDIAAPILEELALALDPYPRAPGAVLPVAEDPDLAEESPFAVLKALKGSESVSEKPAETKGKTAGKLKKKD